MVKDSRHHGGGKKPELCGFPIQERGWDVTSEQYSILCCTIIRYTIVYYTEYYTEYYTIL